ncbi:MAG: SDR family NAD(P)-dependent oxidoreductase [Bacteroidota bacterium]
MNLTNHKILITGGSSGIGLAMARRLKALGNHIIITGRNRAKLEEAGQKYDLDIFQCDLAENEDILALVKATKNQHPDLNILINNAGIQYNYSFEEGVPFEMIDHEIGVNLNAALKLCSAFIPILSGKQESAIVNVSSGLGISPKRSAPVYCATKAGLHIFSKALRYQLESTSIKVFEVIPPLVDTPMTVGRGKDKISPEDLVEEFISGLEKNRYEMNIGKVKLLKMMHRISPAIADSILKNN